MLKIKELPKTERPRERLVQQGPRALSNAELLAIIISTGNKNENALEVSQRILQKYHLHKLSRIDISSLKKIKGIGMSKAAQITACFELSRRLAGEKDGKLKIRTTKDIAKMLIPELSGLKKEHFIGVYLDSHNKIIKKETIFIGSLTATVIHPREVFLPAILESAAKVVLAHNHPSGNHKPSEEDIIITQRLVDAGRTLGIEFVDHLIIGNKKYTAVIEQGYC